MVHLLTNEGASKVVLKSKGVSESVVYQGDAQSLNLPILWCCSQNTMIRFTALSGMKVHRGEKHSRRGQCRDSVEVELLTNAALFGGSDTLHDQLLLCRQLVSWHCWFVGKAVMGRLSFGFRKRPNGSHHEK